MQRLGTHCDKVFVRGFRLPTVLCGFGSRDFAGGTWLVQCFTETVGKNTLVVGSYEAADTSLTSQGLLVTVTAPSQKSEYSKTNEDRGKFAFTSSEDGNYKVCFTNKCKYGASGPGCSSAGAIEVDSGVLAVSGVTGTVLCAFLVWCVQLRPSAV